MIKVSIEYEVGFNLPNPFDEEKEFSKLKEIVENDTEKFILNNLENSKKTILYEII